MQLDIQKIAQQLVDELLAEQKKISEMIIGVNMLYERLVDKIEQAQKLQKEVQDAGREEGSVPLRDSEEAQPASTAAEPDSRS